MLTNGDLISIYLAVVSIAWFSMLYAMKSKPTDNKSIVYAFWIFIPFMPFFLFLAVPFRIIKFLLIDSILVSWEEVVKKFG